MGKSIGKLILVFVLACLLVSGCGKKKSVGKLHPTGQLLKDFTMEVFGDTFKLTITGIAAEKKSSESQASVSGPTLEIKSKNFIVEIKTGPKGTGEVFLDPETQGITRIIIQNNVNISQKNPETGQINFSANCDKLTYLEKEEIVIMEGSPKVQQGENIYRADRIIYSFRENRLRFEGNVQVNFRKGISGN
ncbi:MAG: hypothetical protein NC906_02060 [Candidatus Omnitrophica bacterium]|nr:hypothetical protein [Candidatus Omnitrophota bacterium]MCM8817735.1 hypothetical protein [Candidatus Omnitrophota bacterium]